MDKTVGRFHGHISDKGYPHWGSIVDDDGGGIKFSQRDLNDLEHLARQLKISVYSELQDEDKHQIDLR